MKRARLLRAARSSGASAQMLAWMRSARIFRLTPKKAPVRRLNRLPVPTFRLRDSQGAPLMVSVADLAALVEERHAAVYRNGRSARYEKIVQLPSRQRISERVGARLDSRRTITHADVWACDDRGLVARHLLVMVALRYFASAPGSSIGGYDRGSATVARPTRQLERGAAQGDPFEICNSRAQARGSRSQVIDVTFDALMRRRAAEAREVYERERRT
jgi:hypothetical protein